MASDHRNTTDKQSDEELMLLYQKGNEQAFEVLYWRHQRGIFNYISHFIGESGAQAEDLLQDIFLKVVKASKRYEPSAKFTTWLYQIARNGCIDHFRKMKHRKTTSLSQPIDREEDLTIESTIANNDPSPEKSARITEITGLLQEALKTLPEEQREVFLMREDLNLSFAEIAESIGCPINTAKSRMRYALEHLRKTLKREGITQSEVTEGEMSRM
ncbi:MAG: RNA polymerase sigma factor [Thermodesulfobacteriota bacterium]|nr:RNA polymerase sigma factor [Thermodesulfobacteriota bacterium]